MIAILGRFSSAIIRDAEPIEMAGIREYHSGNFRRIRE
jgi:hypothetical protein